MSNIVFYLKLETYLRQWLTHHLGSPVAFPPQSNENAIIRRFLTRRPAGVPPELATEGLTAICIPDSKAKPPIQFNHLGEKAKRAVREAIEDLFRINMWNELNDLIERRHLGINATVEAWCEMHGIDERYSDTIRQKYYRMRDAYQRKGVNLDILTINRTDK